MKHVEIRVSFMLSIFVKWISKETQEKKRRVYVSTNTSDVRSSGLGQD